MEEIIRLAFAIIGIVSLVRSVIIEDDRWFRLYVIVILFYIAMNL